MKELSKKIENTLKEEFPDLKIYIGYEFALDIMKECFIVIFEGENVKSQYTAFQFPIGSSKSLVYEKVLNGARTAFKQALESI